MTIRRTTSRLRTALGSVLAALLLPTLASAQGGTARDEIFARYARYGADTWATNPMASITGEGRACVSCHTSVPYALVEPLLPGDYPAYRDLVANVDNRIRTWADNTPWYADAKLRDVETLGGLPTGALSTILNGPDSRGPEAIFNALIRATADAYAGRPAQRETRLAFEHLWAEQVKSGPKRGLWNWIRANLVPWEVADADVWGASLSCVAASVFEHLAPQSNLDLLHGALRQAADSPDVSLHAKAAVVWCDAESSGRVLAAAASATIVADLLAEQRRDGGWALRELGPWVGWAGSDKDCCASRDVRPDAYATGFTALALTRRAGQRREDLAAPLDLAIAWIERELANPYPAEPRHNKHSSSDKELPALRNHLYTNAGHMWAFLARAAHESSSAPWRR